MRFLNPGLAFLLGIVACAVAVMAFQGRSSGETAEFAGRRTADGRPDFSGIWQAQNTAHWDLEAHPARQGPVFALGAAFSVPAGLGVVEGGEIPYRPEALARKRENAEDWLARDPEIKCFLPGVPRATYMPYPFQIVQTPDAIFIAYEFANATRTVYMTDVGDSPMAMWMGWSRGRWEGDTLVVDVDSLHPETWFDRAGNYHGNQLQVTERYSAIDENTLQYEATMTDPDVFTRPWTIRMPLYRRVEAHAELLEYKCVEFAEELLYGHLRRQSP